MNDVSIDKKIETLRQSIAKKKMQLTKKHPPMITNGLLKLPMVGIQTNLLVMDLDSLMWVKAILNQMYHCDPYPTQFHGYHIHDWQADVQTCIDRKRESEIKYQLMIAEEKLTSLESEEVKRIRSFNELEVTLKLVL